MSLTPRLAALLLFVLLAGCAEEPVPVTPEPEPIPVAADEGASMFASAASEITVEEKPNLGVLTQGGGEEKKETAARAGGTEQVIEGRTLSASQVQSVIKSKMPQVRACYERELKADESLRGKVVLGWTIQANGKVTGARTVRNGTRSKALPPCMIRTVSRWVFPAAEAPFDVEYPFVFKPAF